MEGFLRIEGAGLGTIRKEIRATEEEFLESVSSPKDQERKEAQEEQTPVSYRQGKTATSGAAEQLGG